MDLKQSNQLINQINSSIKSINQSNQLINQISEYAKKNYIIKLIRQLTN